MIEIRCEECNKKLGEIEDNKLKIVCSRCKNLTEYAILGLGGYNSYQLVILQGRQKDAELRRDNKSQGNKP